MTERWGIVREWLNFREQRGNDYGVGNREVLRIVREGLKRRKQ